MRKNKNLYFYGMYARLLQVVGIFVIWTAMFWGVLLNFNLRFWVLLILGIALILYGNSVRFDYKRRSGTIIHRGDW